MKPFVLAALALVLPASSLAQAPAAPAGGPDLSFATAVAGNWTYTASAGGSDATFFDGQSRAQVSIRCTRATRRVAIVKPVSAAAPTMWIWTSSQSRSLAASFDPKTLKLSVDLQAFDPLLDAIAGSRGRVGFSTAGTAPLVVAPWSEVGRVIEDCRV